MLDDVIQIKWAFQCLWYLLENGEDNIHLPNHTQLFGFIEYLFWKKTFIYVYIAIIYFIVAIWDKISQYSQYVT